MREKYNKLYKKCSDFFGRVNYKSTLKIVLFVLPITFVLQLILTTGSNTYQKNVVSKQAIQLSKINSLVSPSEMIPGIINSDTRYVINSTADYAEEISSENSKLLCPAGMSISLRYSYGCLVTKSNLKTIEKNLREYSATLNAVLDFMEYNPEVDFTNYSPGATNTTDRINFLKEGVALTLEDINKLGFNNEYTESMKVMVIESQMQSKN